MSSQINFTFILDLGSGESRQYIISGLEPSSHQQRPKMRMRNRIFTDDAVIQPSAPSLSQVYYAFLCYVIQSLLHLVGHILFIARGPVTICSYCINNMLMYNAVLFMYLYAQQMLYGLLMPTQLLIFIIIKIWLCVRYLYSKRMSVGNTPL